LRRAVGIPANPWLKPISESIETQFFRDCQSMGLSVAVQHLLLSGNVTMKQIQSKISQVIRRLFLQEFVGRFPWFLFVALMLAAIAFAIPKVVYWQFLENSQNLEYWKLGWAWGSATLATAACLLVCWWNRVNRLAAAEEFDNRFDLKERVSSTIATSADKADPGFYQALLDDTAKQVEDLHVAERFPIRSRWPLALPLIPIALLFGSVLLPNMENVIEDESLTLAEKDKQELAQLIKKASVKEKSDSDEPTAEIEPTRMVQEAIDKAEKALTKEGVTKKEAMVAINDVKKAIQDQQDKLGQADALKDRLKQLKDQVQGPADKMNKALKEGDFGEAQNQLAKLAEKIANGDMSKDDAEKLANQMEGLQKQLNEIKQDFEAKKQDLQRQIDQALAEGDLQRAADLEKQKKDLDKAEKQMDQLGQLAEQGKKIADLMKQAQENDGELNEQQKQELKEAIQQMQQQMQDMELDAKQMEQLKDLMEQMDGMKDKMKGKGMPAGDMQFNEGKGDEKGKGLGEGEGEGLRPEQEGDTKFYNSKVNPEVKPGEVAKIGRAGGANKKGVSKAEIQEAIKQAAENKELTPDELQEIPFNQRDHVRDYFKKLRDN